MKSYCRELFEKCCHNNIANYNSEYEEEELVEASKNAYVLCTDIIAYFKEQVRVLKKNLIKFYNKIVKLYSKVVSRCLFLLLLNY